MGVSADIEEWLEWMLTTSVPLVRLDESGDVTGRASGTLVDFEDGRFVLSVAHAIPRESSRWAIEIGLDPAKGTEIYHVGPFVYPSEFTRSTASLRELDLCVARISPEVEPWYEYRTPRGLFDKRRRHIFKASDFASPDTQSTYGFAGRVRPERVGIDFFFEMNVYPGLKFVQTNAEIHEFRLPVPHPGHEAFQGCSGAPMVDTNRRIVGLVTSGCQGENVVRSISLDRCIPALRFLLGKRAL